MLTPSLPLLLYPLSLLYPPSLNSCTTVPKCHWELCQKQCFILDTSRQNFLALENIPSYAFYLLLVFATSTIQHIKLYPSIWRAWHAHTSFPTYVHKDHHFVWRYPKAVHTPSNQVKAQIFTTRTHKPHQEEHYSCTQPTAKRSSISSTIMLHPTPSNFIQPWKIWNIIGGGTVKTLPTFKPWIYTTSFVSHPLHITSYTHTHTLLHRLRLNVW